MLPDFQMLQWPKDKFLYIVVWQLVWHLSQYHRHNHFLLVLFRIYWSGTTLISMVFNTFKAWQHSIPNVSNFLQLHKKDLLQSLNETFHSPTWSTSEMMYSNNGKLSFSIFSHAARLKSNSSWNKSKMCYLLQHGRITLALCLCRDSYSHFNVLDQHLGFAISSGFMSRIHS